MKNRLKNYEYRGDPDWCYWGELKPKHSKLGKIVFKLEIAAAQKQARRGKRRRDPFDYGISVSLPGLFKEKYK